MNYETQVIPALQAEVARLTPLLDEVVALRNWKARTVGIVGEVDRLLALDPLPLRELTDVLRTI